MNRWNIIIIFACCFLFVSVTCAQFTSEQKKQIDSLNAILSNSHSHDTSLAKAYLGLSEILYLSNLDTLLILCEKSKSLAEQNLLQTTLNVKEKKTFKVSLGGALNNIGYFYYTKGDMDKAIKYYLESLSISIEIQDKKTEGSLSRNLGLAYNAKGDMDKALTYSLRSLKINEKINDKAGQALSLNDIGDIYTITVSMDKALAYYLSGLKIVEEIEDKEGESTLLNNIGDVYHYKGDIDKALEYSLKSLKISEQINKKGRQAVTLNNIGRIYEKLGDITKALEYLFKSLKLSEEVNDKKWQALALNNIGVIYKDQGDVDKALMMFTKSLKIREVIGDKHGQAESTNNMGVIYHRIKKDNNKALKYYSNSLKIDKEINDKKGQAASLNNIGTIYMDQGNNDMALMMFMKSLKIREEMGDKEGHAVALNNIAKAMLEQNKLHEAYDYAEHSLRIANELGFPKNINQAAKTLSEIAKKQGNHNEALKYYELHITMRDSVRNQETEKATVKQQMKYEFEKQQAIEKVEFEKEKEILARQNEIQQLQLSNNRYVIIGLSGGIVITFIIAWLLLLRNRQRLKNKALHLELDLLQKQMNPHFLFNALSSIQNCILNEDKKVAYEYHAKFAKLIRNILLQSREKTITLKEEIESLMLYLELEAFRTENKFEYEIKIDDGIDTSEIKIPTMLLQPHVENAIWHGILPKKEKGKVAVTISQENNILKCTIQDDGVGIGSAILNSGKNHKSFATQITKERIELFNIENQLPMELKATDLNDKDTGATGTLIELNIPLISSSKKAA